MTGVGNEPLHLWSLTLSPGGVEWNCTEGRLVGVWRTRELVVGIGKQPRLMNFSVTENEKFTDGLLDSTLY